MNNFLSAFKGWLHDPFGRKKLVAHSRKIIADIAETKVEVRAAVYRRQGQQFPISSMVTKDSNK